MPVFGSLRTRFKKRVQKDLAENAAWAVRAGRGWICPFCCELAADELPDDEERRVDAVLDHLIDSPCAPFRRGEGHERPIAEVRRAGALRELRRRAKRELVRNGSWQLMDLRRRWYCPFCAEPTDVTIPEDQRMTEDVLRAIVVHVEQCFAFERGRGEEKPLEQLRATVKHANRALKLAEDVKRKLEQDPAWRKKDPRGRWVCPFCQRAQEHVDLSTTLAMFENAPPLIARHLVSACEAWREGRPRETAPTNSSASAGGSRTNAGFSDQASRSNMGGPRSSSIAVTALPARDEPLRAKIPETNDEASQGTQSDASRTGVEIWGRDATAAERLGKATTLRKLESSGEFLMIDDPEVRKITAGSRGGARDAGAAPPAESAEPPRASPSAQSVVDWRAEIERELQAVKSQVPGTSQTGEARDEESVAAEAREVARVAGLPGLEVRAFARPATPARGDFVEAMRIDDARVAIILGGVAGTEPEGALVAAMARNLLKIHASRDPSADALRRVNQEIFADLDARTFVSAALITVDVRRRSLEIARAGLTPPLLVNARRSPPVVAIDAEGMVMGIDRGPIFDRSLEARRIDLQPGDLLFAATNGILELRSAVREELGVERIHGLVKRYGNHEAEYLIHRLSRFLEEFTRGTDATADACAVALKLAGPS